MSERQFTTFPLTGINKLIISARGSIGESKRVLGSIKAQLKQTRENKIIDSALLDLENALTKVKKLQSVVVQRKRTVNAKKKQKRRR